MAHFTSTLFGVFTPGIWYWKCLLRIPVFGWSRNCSLETSLVSTWNSAQLANHPEDTEPAPSIFGGIWAVGTLSFTQDSAVYSPRPPTWLTLSHHRRRSSPAATAACRFGLPVELLRQLLLVSDPAGKAPPRPLPLTPSRPRHPLHPNQQSSLHPIPSRLSLLPSPRSRCISTKLGKILSHTAHTTNHDPASPIFLAVLARATCSSAAYVLLLRFLWSQTTSVSGCLIDIYSRFLTGGSVHGRCCLWAPGGCTWAGTLPIWAS